MKILPISNYQMQNQKQDVAFGVHVDNKTITKLQQCIANGAIEGSHNTADALEILQKLDDGVIESIKFISKGGLLLKWKDMGLASTIEIPSIVVSDKVAIFLDNLLRDGDTARMSGYLQKVAARYFPVEIAEVRLKFPACGGDEDKQILLAKFEQIKKGRSVDLATLGKWSEGQENDAYGNSNHLV